MPAQRLVEAAADLRDKSDRIKLRLPKELGGKGWRGRIILLTQAFDVPFCYFLKILGT